MTAASIMDPNPAVLKQTNVISTAASYIMEHRYRNLPVVDDDGCYLGIFGVNCLLRLVLPPATLEKGLDSVSFIHQSLADLHDRLREVQDQPITLCMKAEVETVAPDTPLVETLLILYRTKTSIPVVEPGTCKLLGMISYWDVGEKIISA
ncbi:MAG: CBS domain-containing protein [Gammaproteobacteria bacterium]|nr:CBS domain-containing protein [Gammaproteobacteria bacterium]